MNEEETLTPEQIEIIERVIAGVINRLDRRPGDRFPDRPAKRTKFTLTLAISLFDNGYVQDRDAGKFRHGPQVAQIVKLAISAIYPELRGVAVEIRSKFEGAEYDNEG